MLTLGVLTLHSLQIHSRVAEMLYLPAYLSEYQYGTRYKKGTSGVTVPQIFQAVVGGTCTGVKHCALPRSAIEVKCKCSLFMAGYACKAHVQV